MRVCIVYNQHPTGCSYYRLEMPSSRVHEMFGTEAEFVYMMVALIVVVGVEVVVGVVVLEGSGVLETVVVIVLVGVFVD